MPTSRGYPNSAPLGYTDGATGGKVLNPISSF